MTTALTMMASVQALPMRIPTMPGVGIIIRETSPNKAVRGIHFAIGAAGPFVRNEPR